MVIRPCKRIAFSIIGNVSFVPPYNTENIYFNNIQTRHCPFYHCQLLFTASIFFISFRNERIMKFLYCSCLYPQHLSLSLSPPFIAICSSPTSVADVMNRAGSSLITSLKSAGGFDQSTSGGLVHTPLYSLASLACYCCHPTF
jgi:hypothetical protein